MVRAISTLCVVLMMCAPSCTKRSIQRPRDFRDQRAPSVEQAPKPEIDTRYAIEIDDERIDMTKEYFYLHNRAYYDEIVQREPGDVLRIEPRVIVVHFTAIPTLAETVAYFEPNRIAGDRGDVTRQGDLNVGIQFICDSDGTIYQSYPENFMARHVIGLNHVAIGIENVGSADLGLPPDEGGLTQAQLAANVKLIRYLLAKYPEIEYVVGHSEYTDFQSPHHPGHHLFHEAIDTYRTEKVDPGERFLNALRKELRKDRP